MKIFNSMSRQKEEFVPMEPGKVKHLRLRPHGVQLHPCGQRPPHHASLMSCAVILNTAATM